MELLSDPLGNGGIQLKQYLERTDLAATAAQGKQARASDALVPATRSYGAKAR